MRVGIVGRRSWLAPHLRAELLARGHDPVLVEKSAVGEPLPYDVIVLIAGRARPTRQDMEAERELVGLARRTQRRPKLVYLSSSAVDRWERGSRPLSPAGELYVLGKRACEAVVMGGPSGCGYVIRLPVVFGPGQPLDSDMLVPSAVRARLGFDGITLRDPFGRFELVHVSDAMRATVDLIDDLVGDPLPVRSVRSDLHQPIWVASVIAPGALTTLARGWEWRPPPVNSLLDREPGQRHVTEVTYALREDDLRSTATWYEENTREIPADDDAFLLSEVIDV